MPGSASGRRAKVSLLALSLLSTLVVHVPWLPIEIQAAGQQFLYLAGHEHTWNLFAANPRNVSLALWGEVTKIDGTVERWLPQRYDGPLGDLIHYRPIRWVEYQYSNRDDLGLGGLARWLASQDDDSTSVILSLEVRTTPAPGDLARTPKTETLITYDLGRQP